MSKLVGSAPVVPEAPATEKIERKTLVFLAVVMLTNALAYGTIIPLLYPYAAKFGLDPLGLSLMFASFSFFQFFATPIIGRLSDIYGRRPLLLWSILGTGISLILFAVANSVWLLFLSRIIDGITGGNMSVAQAAIADKVQGPERAKAFGFLMATFGFGFLVGPAIGGLLSTWFLAAPFWFAGILAFVAAIFGYFFLEETLPPEEKKEHTGEPLINFKEMIHALYMPVIGLLLLVNLAVSTAGNAFIIGFQSFTNDVLHLSTRDIGIFFTAIGGINIIMQGYGIGKILQWFPNKPKLLLYSTVAAATAISLLFIPRTLMPFAAVTFLYILSSTALYPVLSGLLSQKAPQEEQGMILGINQSYMSLGQIIGPLLAGTVARFSVPAVFLLSGFVFVIAFFLTGKAFNWKFAPMAKTS